MLEIDQVAHKEVVKMDSAHHSIRDITGEEAVLVTRRPDGTIRLICRCFSHIIITEESSPEAFRALRSLLP